MYLFERKIIQLIACKVETYSPAHSCGNRNLLESDNHCWVPAFAGMRIHNACSRARKKLSDDFESSDN